jgi:3-hydroxyacyl-[acyl-carrier-protein] dehydratase
MTNKSKPANSKRKAKNKNFLPIHIEKIMQSLPHRYPLLLVDKVVEMEPKKSITAIKNITFNEPQFAGHFPNHPIMPGVLIIEAMAQAGALMITCAEDAEDYRNKLVYFISVDSAKFRKPVIPGDCLELKIKVVQNRGAVWKFEGEAVVDGQKVAEAHFAAMVVDKDKKIT